MANDYIFSIQKLLLFFLIISCRNAVGSASIIKYLPGFEGPLPFELETGYIGVGEEEQVQLFYYFIKSEGNPEEDPILLWLSGGPGCSSISGLLYENGPMTMKLEVYNGTVPSLVSTTYSWTKTLWFIKTPMANDYVFSIQKLFLFFLIISCRNAVGSASIIKYLPGFDGPLPFELETGYIGVGEEEQVQLFYYFIKSEGNPEEDPILLWLSGGPGCSSISGFLYENGPMTMKLEVYNGTVPSLVSTTYSWTKISSIIYLDQPVGTGFSYSRTHKLASKPSDLGEAKRIHEFLHKVL
ncbi:hypothetical protein DY000_02050983 [Brassica cretica]|uniref:Uncharacterized protein n=1 Tax=Brassica cretica TaxID=69181 RepID=A0ABQ7F2W2_BRACR|nr:hypothetical protein DY000_02050983 [Brassica cretica]